MYERLINQASAADDAVYHMEEAQVALRECGLGEYASILDEFIEAAILKMDFSQPRQN